MEESYTQRAVWAAAEVGAVLYGATVFGYSPLSSVLGGGDLALGIGAAIAISGIVSLYDKVEELEI